MKKYLLASLLLCIASAVAQQPAPKASGRFQIVTATVSDTSGATSPDRLDHVVFLVDTQTGQVWRYFTRVGGVRDLKPQDQYSLDDKSTTNGISPGALVPVPKIELTGKPSTH
jgi:hypothetical protein